MTRRTLDLVQRESVPDVPRERHQQGGIVRKEFLYLQP